VARIEDCALIGDCHSAALVSRHGSIDWLCLPRFDSAACFAALLGTRRNGLWRIAPAGVATRITRQYRGDTLVLETVFETADGAVALIDFMTIEPSTAVRIVAGRCGVVPCCLELVLRFDYGISIPWVTRLRTGHGIRAVCGAEQVVVRADIPLLANDMTTVADFTVSEGQRVRFSLSHAPSHLKLPGAADPDVALNEAEAHWRAWSDRSTYHGRWRSQVRRSLLTLKALTDRATGGIAAAVTTSFPEKIGGIRNWDYRFCWPRDSSFERDAPASRACSAHDVCIPSDSTRGSADQRTTPILTAFRMATDARLKARRCSCATTSFRRRGTDNRLPMSHHPLQRQPDHRCRIERQHLRHQ
jgi:GH15 family glucan-1,4-alpha-glucosidase